MSIRNTRLYRNRQTGISLLVVLVLLIMMSVLGIAVLRSAAMQERMGANMYDRSLALQAAERALVAGRTALGTAGAATMNPAAITTTTCANSGICPSFTTAANVTWQAGPTLGGAGGVPTTTTQYWIEYLGENSAYMETGGVVPTSETASMGPMFRITARAQQAGRASVTLQSDVLYRIPRL